MELAPTECVKETKAGDFATANLGEKHYTINGQSFTEKKVFLIDQGERMTITDCKFFEHTTFYCHSAATLQLDKNTFYQNISIECENSHTNQFANVIVNECNFFGRVMCSGMTALLVDESKFCRDVFIDAKLVNIDVTASENLVLINECKFLGRVEVECCEHASFLLGNTAFHRDVNIRTKESSENGESNDVGNWNVVDCKFFGYFNYSDSTRLRFRNNEFYREEENSCESNNIRLPSKTFIEHLCVYQGIASHVLHTHGQKVADAILVIGILAMFCLHLTDYALVFMYSLYAAIGLWRTSYLFSRAYLDRIKILFEEFDFRKILHVASFALFCLCMSLYIYNEIHIFFKEEPKTEWEICTEQIGDYIESISQLFFSTISSTSD